jgi:hypothetical protein
MRPPGTRRHDYRLDFAFVFEARAGYRIVVLPENRRRAHGGMSHRSESPWLAWLNPKTDPPLSAYG